MERLTEKGVSCFGYSLKGFKHNSREFNDYDTFYAYSMAVKRLGELEDCNETKNIYERLEKLEEQVKNQKRALYLIIETWDDGLSNDAMQKFIKWHNENVDTDIKDMQINDDTHEGFVSREIARVALEREYHFNK